MAKTRHALSAKTKNFIVTCAIYRKTSSTHSRPQMKKTEIGIDKI